MEEVAGRKEIVLLRVITQRKKEPQGNCSVALVLVDFANFCASIVVGKEFSVR